jgi:outer membrane receptor protein involved in Fe transport
MLNAHVSLDWTEQLRFGAFAKNLLNDQGFVNPFSLYGTGSRSRPRTYGIEFAAKFE